MDVTGMGAGAGTRTEEVYQAVLKVHMPVPATHEV